MVAHTLVRTIVTGVTELPAEEHNANAIDLIHQSEEINTAKDKPEVDRSREIDQSRGSYKRKRKYRSLTDIIGVKQISKASPVEIALDTLMESKAVFEGQQSPRRKMSTNQQEEVSIHKPFKGDKGKAIVTYAEDADARLVHSMGEGLFIGSKEERQRNRTGTAPAPSRKKDKHALSENVAKLIRELPSSPAAANLKLPSLDQNEAGLSSQSKHSRLCLDLCLGTSPKLSHQQNSGAIEHKNDTQNGDFLHLGPMDKSSDKENQKETDLRTDDIPVDILELPAKQQFDHIAHGSSDSGLEFHDVELAVDENIKISPMEFFRQQQISEKSTVPYNSQPGNSEEKIPTPCNMKVQYSCSSTIKRAATGLIVTRPKDIPPQLGCQWVQIRPPLLLPEARPSNWDFAHHVRDPPIRNVLLDFLNEMYSHPNNKDVYEFDVPLDVFGSFSPKVQMVLKEALDWITSCNTGRKECIQGWQMNMWASFVHSMMLKEDRGRVQLVPTIFSFTEFNKIKKGKTTFVNKLIKFMREMPARIYVMPSCRQKHWKMLLIFPEESVIYCIDSGGSGITNRKRYEYDVMMRLGAAYDKDIKSEGTSSEGPKDWKIINIKHKHQPFGWECGYYCMLYVEKILLLHSGVAVQKVFYHDFDAYPMNIIEGLIDSFCRAFMAKCAPLCRVQNGRRRRSAITQSAPLDVINL